MILMMLIGGGMGSTAGGIKLCRVNILCEQFKAVIYEKVTGKKKVMFPIIQMASGKIRISDLLLKDTIGFVMTYLCIFWIGTLLITMTANVSVSDASFEFASSLGTVGLSVGVTGTDTNVPTMLVEIAGMFLGRLEIFTILSGCYMGTTSIAAKMKGLKLYGKRKNQDVL